MLQVNEATVVSRVSPLVAQSAVEEKMGLPAISVAVVLSCPGAMFNVLLVVPVTVQLLQTTSVWKCGECVC